MSEAKKDQPDSKRDGRDCAQFLLAVIDSECKADREYMESFVETMRQAIPE